MARQAPWMLTIGRGRMNDGLMEVQEVNSYLRESNGRLATSVFFNTSEFVMLLENNTNMYFFIELDNLLLSFSKNEDEGIMSVSPTGNFLRNRNYGYFDYVLIPPNRKAEISFFGLESPIIFPTSLPSKTLIQYSIFSFAFPTNPWDTIKEKISEEDRNGDKILVHPRIALVL